MEYEINKNKSLKDCVILKGNIALFQYLGKLQFSYLWFTRCGTIFFTLPSRGLFRSVNFSVTATPKISFMTSLSFILSLGIFLKHCWKS